MTTSEAIAHQLKQLKGKPLKEKLEHIITYFWGPILGVLAVIVLGIFLIVHFSTRKVDALNVFCLNSFIKTEEAKKITEDFADFAGIDTDQYAVWLNTGMVVSDLTPTETYEAIQTLSARVAAGAVDILVADMDAFGIFLYQDYFCDLSQILTPAQQARLKDYIIYVDRTYMEAKLSGKEVPVPFPDPTKPEEMDHPVPVALLLPSDNEFVQKNYSSIKAQIAFGIVVNGRNQENALAFLDYVTAND